MNDTSKLLALEQLKKLKARYFRCVDTKDWEGFRGLFADDAVIDISDDIPGCVVTGADKIVQTASEPLAGVVSVHHGHCPELELTSDVTATGIWAMEDMLWWPENSSAPIRALHGYGHYYETYECIDGRWVIKTMKLRRLRVDITRRD
jgi:hypothetical protein